jgi:phage-related minor tail protein
VGNGQGLKIVRDQIANAFEKARNANSSPRALEALVEYAKPCASMLDERASRLFDRITRSIPSHRKLVWKISEPKENANDLISAAMRAFTDSNLNR